MKMPIPEASPTPVKEEEKEVQTGSCACCGFGPENNVTTCSPLGKQGHYCSGVEKIYGLVMLYRRECM